MFMSKDVPQNKIPNQLLAQLDRDRIYTLGNRVLKTTTTRARRGKAQSPTSCLPRCLHTHHFYHEHHGSSLQRRYTNVLWDLQGFGYRNPSIAPFPMPPDTKLNKCLRFLHKKPVVMCACNSCKFHLLPPVYFKSSLGDL